VSIDDKEVYGLNYVFIKYVQANVHKCITWLKKFNKDRQDGIKLVLILN